MKFHFDPAARTLPESYDYGVGAASVPGTAVVGTDAQRLEFARLTHRRPKNAMEYERVCRTLLVGEDAGSIYGAVLTWPNHPDVLREWDRLDGNEAKDEVADGLPAKSRWARDVYNMAQDARLDADDRLKAFRLYAEGQGYVGVRGGTNVNIDNRAIILVPRRSAKLDDPEREEKVIQAQARLIADARHG